MQIHQTQPISHQEFEARRIELMRRLPNHSGVILKSRPHLIRNGDAEYPYRQDSHFFYLTGINQPEVWVLLIKNNQSVHVKAFCEPKNEFQTRWVGPRLGLDEVKAALNADEVYSIDTLNENMPSLLKGLSQLYFFLDDRLLYGQINTWMNHNNKLIKQGLISPVSFNELYNMLSPLRMIKSQSEKALIKKAIEITEEGHARAMTVCAPGKYEYELEAELIYSFYRHGSRFPAYSSIVAGGANACILHYIENQARLSADELVLIDAGAEYQGYAADITRTFPVSGRFTHAQAEIYNIVLNAQLKGIESAKVGAPFDAIQNAIVTVLAEGLSHLKILPLSANEIIETKAYQRFYMHKSGHWLGLDVHDVGAYSLNGESVTLEPNQVLTIEPGLYIDQNDQSVPSQYRGIGIRIEDDIMVSHHQAEVLSHQLPKTIEEIERFMQHGK